MGGGGGEGAVRMRARLCSATVNVRTQEAMLAVCLYHKEKSISPSRAPVLDGEGDGGGIEAGVDGVDHAPRHRDPPLALQHLRTSPITVAAVTSAGPGQRHGRSGVASVFVRGGGGGGGTGGRAGAAARPASGRARRGEGPTCGQHRDLGSITRILDRMLVDGSPNLCSRPR